MPDPVLPFWDLHETPNPSEWSFSVVAPTSEVFYKLDRIEAFTVGMPFRDFPIIPDGMLAANPRMGDYVFAAGTDNSPTSKRFHFNKNKTPIERNKAFRKQRITDRVTWDAVLEWIQFGKETGFPLSQQTITGQGKQGIATADRWLVPRGYRPEQSLNTVITVEEYLSEVEWPDWAMESDEPQPTEVMWDLVGSHGSMGKVLHPTVNVPAQATAGYKIVSQAGDVQSANSSQQNSFVFPKSNHKKRMDYSINIVKFVNWQYYRQKLTFHVPTPMSKIVSVINPN